MNESITLVLPRSPIIKARKSHHLLALKQWIEESGFKDVMVITSVDAGARGDEALLSFVPPPLHLSLSLPLDG